MINNFDEIYIKVFGFNKKNYDLKREQFEREYIESEEKRKLCMQYNINFWIKEGKKVIITENSVKGNEKPLVVKKNRNVG